MPITLTESLTVLFEDIQGSKRHSVFYFHTWNPWIFLIELQGFVEHSLKILDVDNESEGSHFRDRACYSEKVQNYEIHVASTISL
ncbi:hypothetical protein TNCV_4010771 [Trichonephila clavipes]|nr:hypothetical protein TNCV_4010771 [Trichonephila clavipes]